MRRGQRPRPVGWPWLNVSRLHTNDAAFYGVVPDLFDGSVRNGIVNPD